MISISRWREYITKSYVEVVTEWCRQSNDPGPPRLDKLLRFFFVSRRMINKTRATGYLMPLCYLGSLTLYTKYYCGKAINALNR
jgi:hypothetical protein